MKKKTILLIEDNPGDARLIRELLKEFCLECDVTHAKTLSAGLHALAESAFDIILLDLTLPDSTGEQTFLDVNAACGNTPIVLITGLADDELALKLVKEGAQDFINKSNLTSLYLGKAIQYSVERKKLQQALFQEIEQRKTAEEDVIRSRNFYLTLFEGLPALIWRAGLDTHCDYFNTNWLTFTGRTMEQEIGDGWTEGVHPDDLQRCVDIYLAAFKKREWFEMEYRLRHHSGEYRWIIDYGRPFNDLDGTFAGYIGSCFDISDRKNYESEILKLIRINRMLSNTNQLIVRTKDIDTVYREACNIAVRDGGFLMAFIALRDGNTNTVVVNAHSGIAEDYLQHINIDLHDDVRSGGPLGKTLLTGKYHYSNDIENDPSMAPWKEEALKRGFRSAAVFPLIVRETTIGAVTFYSALKNFFALDEFDMLSEMAMDISFAVQVNYDETARKKAEEDLLVSETRFKEVTENAQEWIWESDEKGVYTYSSPVVTSILGYTSDELIGKKTFYDLFDDEYRKGQVDFIFEGFNNKESFHHYVNLNRHKNGSLVHLSTSAVPMLNPDGSLKGYRGVDINITEQVVTAEVLRKSEEQYRRLTDAFPNGTVNTYDKDLRMTFVGGSDLKKYHADAKDFVGKTFYELSPPETVAIAEPAFRKAFSGETVSYDTPYFDGRYYHVVVAPLYDVNMEINEILVISQDVSEKIKAEMHLRESEERYRIIAENVTDVIWVLDAETQTFTYLSPSVQRILGYTNTECIGRTVEEMVTPASLSFINSVTQERIRKSETGDKTVYMDEIEMVDKNGDTVSVEINMRFMRNPKNGRVEGNGVMRDITARKRAEKEIQFKSRLLEMVEQAVVVTDIDGVITFWNRYAEKLYGWNTDEVIGMNIVDVTPTWATKFQAAEIMKQMKQGNGWSGEFHVQRRDGTEFPAFVTDSPIIDESGKLVGIIGISNDITAVKKSMEQIEEMAIKFGSVWENSIEAMRLTDSDGTIVKVNAAYCSLFKKSKEEIEGKHLCVVHHPDVRASVEKQYAERFRLRSVEKHYEGMVHLWNGEDIMVEGSHAFLEIPNQPTLLLSVFRDVTERVHIMAELSESEKKFRTVVEEAAEIIFTVNNDGMFTYANPAATRSTGYSVEGMKGKTIWELVEPEHRRRVMSTFIRQRSEKIPESSIEFPIITKTGECKWFNLNARLLIEQDRVTGFYVIARDVTELRIATEALLESERKYKNLFNHSPLGIYQSMPNGDLISANKAMADMLGYATPAELLKLNLARNIYYDPKERENLIREHEPHGSTDDTEIRWRKKNGDMIWVQMDARAIKDESGKTVMFEGFIRNITDRKKAESALIESEERFRSVTQSANEAIITTDRRTRIVHWNTGAMRIFGYKEQEILGKDLTTILPSASYAKHRMAVIESKRLNEPRIALKTVETYGRNKNKTEFPVEISVSSWSTSAGEFITEIIRDISDRKKSEELQLLFTTAFESAANGITITNAAGDIIWVNKAFTRMTGYSLEEVKGRNPRILKSGEQTAEQYKHLWDTILSGNVWKGEMVNRKKDGSTYIDEMTITPVRNDHHQISHFVAIKQDVTERNKILDQIDQQARLLAEANDAIIMRDMEHRILYWNKGAEKMYGWTQNEVFGKNACDVLGYDPAVFQKDIEQLIATGEVIGERRHAGKLKKEILAEVRLSVIKDQKGKPKAVMSINTDITEKKAIEKQILRTQRLDSLGTLAGGIAHDLNNVLSPILLSIEILKKMYPEEKTNKIITAVESSAKRGSDIVKQILLFARGIDAKNTVMQCRHLVNDLVSIFKETFPRSITIEHNIPKNVSTIMADPTHFHQLLMNLGVNARDAMPNGGTLTISAENRHIDEQYAKMNIQAKPGNYVMFTVADTGIGMSEEVLNRIFEPFFTTKQIGQGTGLGLATVHTIIKGLQGFIEVKSKPGDGTKFYVYIPAAESSAPVSESGKEKQHVNGNNELILLVEDEESVRTVTKQTLEMFHYRVVTATDGAEGLMVYAQHQQDVSLVITDMMMPIMDGNHLILALRKMKPDLKIIASSGLVDKPAIESYDIQAFLEKPYVAEKLLTTVKEVLTSKNTVQ